MGGRLDDPNLVKPVIDLRRGIVAAGGFMHFDEQEVLRANGSRQEDLWGFNYLLDEDGDEAIEFDSRINQRPADGNMSRCVERAEVREAILSRMARRLVP